jgi:WD40 repeat protein
VQPGSMDLHSRDRRDRLKASNVHHQQGRRPLQATLRGHGDCVTGLLVVDRDILCSTSKDNSSSSSSSSSSSCLHMLASSSRDGRIKLWDLNSQSCVSTWKPSSSSVSLIPGQTLGNVVAAVAGADLALVDLRSNTSAAFKIINALKPPGSGRPVAISCSAAHGSMFALGGRRAVQVWDVRKLSSSSSSSSSHAGQGCKPNCQPVFSSRLPLDQPVTALHLDRVKLVAATSRVTLHSGGSVTVWSLPSGAMVQQLSCS